ncbi:MAG: bifunctional UDP-N-acetylglucosamine diphosphorylase/glucosamine-1-phosphate N-acetyltransferase GlmU [Thermotogota bacterium]
MLGIILAAGMGTRMKSALPKVMHKLVSRPLLEWVLNSYENLIEDKHCDKIAVVIGENMPEVETLLKGWSLEKEIEVQVFYQKERLGTGHAVKMSMPAIEELSDDEPVYILCGDVPLIKSETLKKMLDEYKKKVSDVAVLTVEKTNPGGYGRIVKDQKGFIKKIVEHKDATAEQLAIREINSGIYLVKSSKLKESLKQLKNDNQQGEYYLTDIVEWIDRSGGNAISVMTDDHHEVSGINNRYQLSILEKVARERINKTHMLRGITMIDPSQVYIDPEVLIEPDCILEPMTIIKGKTTIRKGCVIGPMTQIENCEIGENNTIERSHLSGVQVKDNCKIGPFARLREKTVLENDVKIGDFVETKKTTIGKGSKAQHLSYLGDTTIEEDVNIGAGTITCNYNGFSKNKTLIEKEAFIGSNTSLVAPVRIGKGAIVGAGSVIVRDVPKDCLSIARGKQSNKENRASELKKKYKKEKEG